jgi:cysteine desulfurase
MIYADCAATTPLDPDVVEAMTPFFRGRFGNPSSQHELGFDARKAVESARLTLSDCWGITPADVVFTSCGSEANNLALRGVAMAYISSRSSPPHIITSAVEHASVLETCKQLESFFGCTITYLPVDTAGMVSPEEVKRAVNPSTCLVSILHANNEIGSIQPIREIAKVTAECGVLLHADCVQSGAWIDLTPISAVVDLITVSAHKLYGPKGIAALIRKPHVSLVPIISGGGQENGLRGGTECVPLIAGFQAAVSLRVQRIAEDTVHVARLRDGLISRILMEIPDSTLTGSRVSRLPNHASFVFSGVDAQTLIEQLSSGGVCASSGSACHSGRREISHVLQALGIPGADAQGSLRITLSRDVTSSQVDQIVSVVKDAVEVNRRYMPV